MSADAAPLRLRLLGPFEGQVHGRPLPRLRFRKSQAILALLVLRAGSEVERDWLAGLLWPDTSLPAGLHSVRNCLSDLRRALAPEAHRLRAPTVRTLALDLAGASVDVLAFDAALARGDPAALAEAVALYRGPLLEGSAEEWAFAERQRREHGYLSALEKLAALAQKQGDPAEAERFLRLAVATDPLRESGQRTLMEVLAAGGNYAAALLAYRELRQRLHREMNTGPDPETQALFHRLREEARRPTARPPTRSRLPLTPVPRQSGEAGTQSQRGKFPSPLSTLHPELSTPVAETRLATILVAERSRSVAAMQALQPEEAAALVSRLLGVMVDAILQFGGQVDRMLGDGVLAIFGISPAREDDAERAIRAALVIREAAQCLGMEVAVGINTGPVYLAGRSADGSSRSPGSGAGPHAGPALPTQGVMEVTVAGAAVTVASWLQREAEPGQILVGEGTYRQTRRAFEFFPPSPAAHGPDPPAAAFAVGQLLSRPEKARGIEGQQAALVGRDEELRKLKAVLAELAHGRGQMVSVVGDAGVGKSRLMAELRSGVQAFGRSGAQEVRPERLNTRTPERLAWLEGRCLELNVTTGYSVFIDLFRDFFGWRVEDDECARGERLAAWLQEARARGELAAERVAEMGPLLGNLLSARFESDWDERLQKVSPEQIQYQTFLAVRDFLVAPSQRQPVILVLEDLHWADSLSLSLISFLTESLASAPLGLFCVYRAEREPARPEQTNWGARCAHLAAVGERKCPERFTEIRLRELTPEQSGRLVAALLPGSHLPHSMQDWIQERSHGNPFFVEEMVRSLIDSGRVYREGDRWRAREPGPGEAGREAPPVPESVQSVIQSRCDRLRPELRQILQAASVIGRVFRPRLLAKVVGVQEFRDSGVQADQAETAMDNANPEHPNAQTPEHLNAALWELEDQGLVYEERRVPEVEYSFRHVLMQETIYQSLLRQRRAELHRQVAEAIEALGFYGGWFEQYEQLAYHYDRGFPLLPHSYLPYPGRGSGVAVDEKAVEYLLKAGEKARRAYLNEDAIRYFERALERLENGRERQEDAAEISDPSAASSSPVHFSPVRRWWLEVLRGLGEVYHGIGRHREAEQRFRQALALAPAIVDGAAGGLDMGERGRLTYWLGETLVSQRRAAEMIGPAEEMLELLGEHTESVEAALMNEMAGAGYRWSGNRQRGREYLERNARFLRRLPYSEELRTAYHSVIQMYSLEDDNVEAATEWAQALEEKARQHQDLRAQGGALELRSGILQVRGDLRGAIPPLVQALEPFSKIGGLRQQYHCFRRLREFFLLLGNLVEAETYASRQREAAEAMGDIREVAVSLVALGKVLLCQGRWDAAWDVFQQAAQVGREDSGLKAWAAYALGRAALAQGKRLEARTHLEEAAAVEISDPLHLIELLGGLEEALDDREAFLAFCHQYRTAHPQPRGLPLVQWYLEPTEPNRVFRISDSAFPAPSADIRNTEHAILGSGWVWHDPFGDCSLTVQDGLEIHAANGRDLSYPNRSAPRLLRRSTGDFAIQAICRSVPRPGGPAPPLIRKVGPAMGGLLLWRNNAHYLRLDWGARGPHEVSFGGCLPGKQAGARMWLDEREAAIGRGRLVSERIYLRLERRGAMVRALCSADGQSWFSVGQIEFLPEDALEVGLHAIGTFDRLIYPGAYPGGTAIRFESFERWTDGDGS